jgi:hypothetical protein
MPYYKEYTDRHRPQLFWGTGSGRDSYCMDPFGHQKDTITGGKVRVQNVP